jgi:hypothetical protein
MTGSSLWSATSAPKPIVTTAKLMENSICMSRKGLYPS